MLAQNRSLLNREYIIMNVLKALASIICVCNLNVILLSNIILITLFTNGISIGPEQATEYGYAIWIMEC
jgi:hypothetical protein